MIRLALVLSAQITGANAGELPVCPPDWSIELVASAPQIQHPSVVCSAPDGRVFVAEDPMDISAPRADLKLGRVICFHPDGKRTVFAEGLYAVFGMQYLEGKLYVLHNPKFSVFEDAGAVGTNRNELIESTNPNPWALDWNDHVPANFRLGMDGFFYIAVGDKGIYGAVGRDGKRVDLHGGGILRMRPDGTELEIFCTGARNILDVAMNDEDEIFTYDNTDEIEWMSRLTHMVEGGFYGYPYDFSPRQGYTLWMMADYGGGAATGTLCYNEDALPNEYRGNLFLADFGKRQILRVGVQRDGATFRAVSREDMFSKVPDDFYPVGIGWGADAKSIYICDWQHRDTKETNAVTGRLWRMTYRGISNPQPKPDWYLPAALGRPTNVPTTELLGALSHASHPVRLTAQRLLAGRSDAQEQIIQLLATAKVPVQAKGHAIWALKGTPDEIINLTRWSRPFIQRQTIRKLGTARFAPARFALEEALRSDDASIRFQAATALGRIADQRSVDPLVIRIDDPDSWVAYAIFTALNRIGRKHPETWERIAHDLGSEFPLRRERTSYALRETYDAQLASVLARIAEDNDEIEARVLALRLLGGIHRKTPEWKGEWWAYHPVKSPPPEKSVEWEGTPQVLAALRNALDATNDQVRIAAVEGIRAAKDVVSAAKLRTMFGKPASVELKQTLVDAFGNLRDTNAGPLLVRALDDASASERLRMRIISALGTIRFAPAVSVLADAAASSSTNIRSAAFEAISNVGGDTALAALSELAANSSAGIRRDAITALGALKNRTAIPVLLKAYSDNETRNVAIESLAQMPDARAVEAYLTGLGDRNAVLREKCRKALTSIRADAWPKAKEQLAKLPPEAISELQRVYKDFAPAREAGLFAIRSSALEPTDYANFARSNPGNAEHGKKLFFDANGVGCAKCHVVSGQGGAVGPDLTTVGSQFARDILIESILYPSKAIREGYQQIVFELKNGDSVSGAVKGESTDSVTIQDSEARLQTVRKSEIARRTTSALSLMPEGLQAALSLTDFADLVAYLEGLKAPGSSK